LFIAYINKAFCPYPIRVGNIDSDCNVHVGYDCKLQMLAGSIGCVAQTLVDIIEDVAVLTKLVLTPELLLKNSEFRV
jgi:hypothetical protein